MNNIDEIQNKLELEPSEKIIYSSTAHTEKTDMQLDSLFIFMLVVILFTILAIITKSLLLWIIAVFLIVCFFYNLLYNTNLKNKYKNEVYFITNKRIIKYDINKNIIYKNINDIGIIQISREKDEYGDLTISFATNSDINKVNHETSIRELAEDVKALSKSAISFSGIENVRYAVKLITDINKNIITTDDKPKSNI